LPSSDETCIVTCQKERKGCNILGFTPSLGRMLPFDQPYKLFSSLYLSCHAATINQRCSRASCVLIAAWVMPVDSY